MSKTGMIDLIRFTEVRAEVSIGERHLSEAPRLEGFRRPGSCGWILSGASTAGVDRS